MIKDCGKLIIEFDFVSYSKDSKKINKTYKFENVSNSKVLNSKLSNSKDKNSVELLNEIFETFEFLFSEFFAPFLLH